MKTSLGGKPMQQELRRIDDLKAKCPLAHPRLPESEVRRIVARILALRASAPPFQLAKAQGCARRCKRTSVLPV